MMMMMMMMMMMTTMMLMMAMTQLQLHAHACSTSQHGDLQHQHRCQLHRMQEITQQYCMQNITCKPSLATAGNA